jgi:hypothetical protein
VGRCELDASALGKGPVAGCYVRGNELAGSMKGGEFLDQLTITFSRKTLLHVVS